MRVPIPTTPIQHSTGSPSHSNQARKKKRKVSEMESKRLSIFADDVIEYTENSKGSIKKKNSYI